MIARRALLFTILTTCALSSFAGAQNLPQPTPQTVVPRLMKFSGVLSDATGKALSGSVDVTFSLYSTEEGGDALWFETQSVQADDLGRYTALLGAMHTDGLPVDLFTSGEAHWLGVRVGVAPEQQPRVLLVSVPYALKAGDAETLGGKPASAYMLSDSQNATAAAAALASAVSAPQTGADGRNQKTSNANASPLTSCSSTVTTNDAATVNSIPMFTTACNIESSNISQSGVNIGIGITSPGAPLHIFGPTATDGSDAHYNLIAADTTSAAAGTGGGILFSGYYSGTTSKAGFANIRGVKENSTQGDYATDLIFDTRANGGNMTERMRINSSGNVGIGTTSPAANLHVSGASPVIELRSTGTGARGLWETVDDTNSVVSLNSSFNSGSSYPITFQMAGIEKVRIDNAGNVGIGTTSPGATLEVNGTAKFDNTVTFPAGQTFPGGTITGSESIAGNLTVGATNSGSFAQLSSNNTGNSWVNIGNANTSMNLGVGATSANPYIYSNSGNFFIGSDGVPTLFVNGMTGGRIGIGTTTPGATLEVNGSAMLDGAVTLGSGSTSHITTATANNDFGGVIQLAGQSTNSHTFSGSPAFANIPICVVSPTSDLGALTWYVTATTTYVSVTISGGSQQTVNFNYVCVGNPN